MSSNIEIPRVCQHCGESFIAKTTVTKFYSHTCTSRNHKKGNREEKIEEVAPIVVQKMEFNQ